MLHNLGLLLPLAVASPVHSPNPIVNITFNATPFGVISMTSLGEHCGFYAQRLGPLPYAPGWGHAPGVFELTGVLPGGLAGNVSVHSTNGSGVSCFGGFDDFEMHFSVPDDFGNRTFTAQVPCPPCCGPSRSVPMKGRASIDAKTGVATFPLTAYNITAPHHGYYPGVYAFISSRYARCFWNTTDPWCG